MTFSRDYVVHADDCGHPLAAVCLFALAQVGTEHDSTPPSRRRSSIDMLDEVEPRPRRPRVAEGRRLRHPDKEDETSSHDGSGRCSDPPHDRDVLVEPPPVKLIGARLARRVSPTS